MLKNTLNSMINQAVKLEVIIKNPCKNIVLPKPDGKKEIQSMTREDQEKFVNYCYDNNEFLFLFMLGTGVRIGEALGLTWDSVDFEKENIRIKNVVVEINGVPKLQSYPKTESSVRDIPMSDKIKEILLKISDNQDKSKNNLSLVFVSKKQKIIVSGNAREKNETVLAAETARYRFTDI